MAPIAAMPRAVLTMLDSTDDFPHDSRDNLRMRLIVDDRPMRRLFDKFIRCRELIRKTSLLVGVFSRVNDNTWWPTHTTPLSMSRASSRWPTAFCQGCRGEGRSDLSVSGVTSQASAVGSCAIPAARHGPLIPGCSEPIGEDHCVNTVAQVQLGEDPVHMRFDRSRR